MGGHRCVCTTDFCREDGAQATIRLPSDEARSKEWCQLLFGQDELPFQRRDPRLSAAHFPPGSLTADVQVAAGRGEAAGVKLLDGALPSQTSGDMERASKGALSRSLRLQALVDRHVEALRAGAAQRRNVESDNMSLRLRILVLEAEVKEKSRVGGGKRGPASAARGRNGINHDIMVGKDDTACRSLCGLGSQESLKKLYGFLDAEGAAEHMIFYDQREGGGLTADGARVERRPKVFRGVNGLFFTLMMLRTGLPLVVISTLFGVHETTGGRAFTTWINFLYRSFKPLVRLPSLEEVTKFAPNNFKRKKLERCAVVLDATELEIPKVWQSDFNWACYSTYKGRQTAKLLVAITPAGAICYVGPAFPGRITDAEIVRESGIIEAMREAGLTGHGLQLMADKGFNSVSPQLIKEDILYVAPPYKRKKEDQFMEPDMKIQWEVANLRIHVERAIGAMKKWSMVDTRFNHKKLDQLEMCFHVVAALVNIIQEPFQSNG